MSQTVFPMAKIFWGGVLLFIDILTIPTFKLFYVLVLAIAIDFITGIIKAKMQAKARTSEGYRKTVVKLMQYIVPVLVIWIGSKNIPEYGQTLKEIGGWLMMFIIYIEFTSILENLYEVDQKSIIAKYVYKPGLKILKFGIENNQVAKAAEELEKKEAEKKANEKQ